MELLLPEMGLLFWSIFTVIVVLLPLLALVSLLRSQSGNNTTKVAWLLAILFIPLLGPACYFVFRK